jgi:hypothetical protein
MNIQEKEINIFAFSEQLSNFVTQFCVLINSMSLLRYNNNVTERAKLW